MGGQRQQGAASRFGSGDNHETARAGTDKEIGRNQFIGVQYSDDVLRGARTSAALRLLLVIVDSRKIAMERFFICVTLV
mgnify:CR=1 FL=1